MAGREGWGRRYRPPHGAKQRQSTFPAGDICEIARDQGRLLDDLSLVEENDVVRDFEDRLDVVADHDRRCFVLALNLLYQVAEKRRADRVQT